MEKHTRYKLFPYGIYRGDELVSVIPMFYMRKKGLKFAYSPPQMTLSYLPYLGFAYSRAYGEMRQREKDDYLLYVTGELEKALRRLSPNYTSIFLEPGDVDARPYRLNGYEPLLQHTYKIDLDQPLESIWSNIESNCRRLIHEAPKLSPTVERTYDVDTFFNMMRERLSYHGKTFFHKQSPDYLKEIMAAYPDNIKMYAVYSGDKWIGATVNCEHRKRLMAWMGCAAAVDHINLNEYMIWSIIKKAKEAGFKEYENPGADDRKLNHFKVKFNPTIVPNYYMIKRDAVYRTALKAQEMFERAIMR